MNRGILLAVSAYIFWGIHPIYWKLLKHVSAKEIVANRMVWSFMFFVLIISFRKEWKSIIIKLKSSNKKWLIILPAFLIGSNWLLYIWAVNNNFIIETSLGYFICPLLSVFLGVIFLKEKLEIIQWFAIGISAIGVLFMTIVYGQFPWIAIYLAFTWSLYGLLRKNSPLNSVEGLTVETATLSIPATIYLFVINFNGDSLFFSNYYNSMLLIMSGIISGFPLIVFISGARKINLSLIGVLQYIYPTLIFLIGVFVYNEQLDKTKLIGFIFIWIALIFYSFDSIKKLIKRS